MIQLNLIVHSSLKSSIPAHHVLLSCQLLMMIVNALYVVQKTRIRQKQINYARMKNEIMIQINESQNLLERNKIKSGEISKQIKCLKSGMRKEVNKVSVVSSSLNSHDDSLLYSKYKEIGELEERLDTFRSYGVRLFKN